MTTKNKKSRSAQSFYIAWHTVPHANHVHWSLFIAISVLATSSIVSVVNIAYSEPSYVESVNNVANVMSVTTLPFEKGNYSSVKDHVLVKFKNTTGSEKKNEILGKHSLKEKSEIKQLGIKILTIPTGQVPEDVVRKLNEQDKPYIEFAEVDQLYAPNFSPDDPYYFYNYQYWLNKIEMPVTWDISTGNNSVTVAILDTGIDSSHPDLARNIIPGWNMYDNNADATEVYSHGSGIAGIVAAVTNNATGVASICTNCKILPIRVSDINGYAMSSVISNALIYAADHGARVANISFGVSTSEAIALAAQYFETKGGIVTVSSGNQGVFIQGDDVPTILTVGATDSSDTIASFSNTGNMNDLSAPGVSIVTTGSLGRYVSGTGTSSSAPIVAGIAALMFSINPTLTPDQVEQILKQSADDLGPMGWDSTYGWGRVNAYKAVATACGYAGATCGMSPTPTPTSTPVITTPTPTPTITPSPTMVTPTPTITPTPTATPTATFTPTPIPPTPTPVPDPVKIISYSVSKKTSTSATINWTTNVPSTGYVDYGTNSNNLYLRQVDNLISTSHSLTIFNLSKNTKYHFQVTAQNTVSTAKTSVSNFRTGAK